VFAGNGFGFKKTRKRGENDTFFGKESALKREFSGLEVQNVQ
jgi:hypothetical protein